MHADFTQKIHVIEIQKPVRVIHHFRGVFPLKIDKPGHLFLETRHIMRDRLLRHHGTHIRSSGRIADHSRAAAEQRDRAMPRALHVRHRHDGNIVPDMETVCRRIESDIKRDLFTPQKFI